MKFQSLYLALTVSSFPLVSLHKRDIFRQSTDRGILLYRLGRGILKLDLLKVVSDSKSLTIFFEVNCLSIFFLFVYSCIPWDYIFLFDMEEVSLTSVLLVVLQTGSVYQGFINLFLQVQVTLASVMSCTNQDFVPPPRVRLLCFICTRIYSITPFS